MVGTGLFHQDVGPVVVVVACSAHDAIEPVLAVVAAHTWRSGGKDRRSIGAHATATAPVFVADAKVFELPGFAVSVRPRKMPIGLLPSEVTYSTHCDISCTVPLPTLPHIYGSHPSCSQRSMNSCVPKWLFSTTPPQLRADHPRALLTWADTVHPVILVRKAAAGPAHHGHLDLAQGSNYIAANAAHVWDGLLSPPGSPS